MDNLFFLEAKCVHTKKTFYIRFDKAAGGIWCQSYGVTEKPQGNDGVVANNLCIDISKTSMGPQYKCPYCGNMSYIQCGSCGKITCKPVNVKEFSCAYCGNSGVVSGYIKEINGKSGMGQ